LSIGNSAVGLSYFGRFLDAFSRAGGSAGSAAP
jgi:hypothetical protein